MLPAVEDEVPLIIVHGKKNNEFVTPNIVHKDDRALDFVDAVILDLGVRGHFPLCSPNNSVAEPLVVVDEQQQLVVVDGDIHQPMFECC